MKIEPQKEHQWLQKLVGEWTYEAEMPAQPGGTAEKYSGTETVRSLGGLWIMAEGQGQMGGDIATTVMTLGFDPKKKRYVGTWIGSMMDYLWVYDGAVDSTGMNLALESDGPHMSIEGQMMKYKDVIEFKSDDHRLLTAHTLGDDGKWQQFMSTSYRRTK